MFYDKRQVILIPLHLAFTDSHNYRQNNIIFIFRILSYEHVLYLWNETCQNALFTTIISDNVHTCNNKVYI